MKLRWKDKTYDVSLAGSRLTISTDGQEPRTVEIAVNGDRITTPEGTSRFAAVRDRGGIWVAAAGRTAYLELARGAAADATADDEVRSPMTGKVVSVEVKTGEKVDAGQVLVVIAAMKMEFRVESPREGEIEAVECEAGSMVDLGQSLVRLAESD